MELKQTVKNLKYVGEKRLKQYNILKINTIKDLLTHFPVKYLTYKKKLLSKIKNQEKAAVFVKVVEKQMVKTRKKITICKILAKDEELNFLEIIYFNNVYVLNSFKVGFSYMLYGQFKKEGVLVKLINPIVLKNLNLITKYALTKGLTKNILVSHIKQALNMVNLNYVFIPKHLEKKYALVDFKTAIFLIHFPKNLQQYILAKKRLVFQELLIWQIAILALKKNKENKNSKILKYFNFNEFLNSLPFELTNAQKRVIKECIKDCKKKQPMNRLIQGDVGCGKTIVAITLCYLFAKQKSSSVLMVPTDILARQHYSTFTTLLKKFNISVGLLVGGLKPKEKKNILEKISKGELDIVIGTHSLFYDSVVFKNLSLIVTDEQHRFGVNQREKLFNKEKAANLLIMSATPIPRTLALIFYGDLDISTINELPAGRKFAKTIWISSKKRDKALAFVKQQVLKKRQAYFVCPAVEKTQNNVVGVLEYAKMLEKKWFLKNRVGVVHGKMSSLEKNQVMEKFLKKELDVLVATTVIEVGVNILNANVILIENAERFGLAQLHQLRGRVLRGSLNAFCILVSDNNTPDNVKRMQAICSTKDGFEIAKKDLKIRGPGEFFGQQQHGKFNFKIANPLKDLNCLKICQKEAKEILEKDENLTKEENKYLKQAVEEIFKKQDFVL